MMKYCLKKCLWPTLAVGIITSTLLFSSCSTDNRRSFSTVVEYNDFIIGELNQLDAIFAEVSNTTDEKTALELCKKLEIKSEKALVNLNIQPFEDDSTLCMAAKEFANFYIGVAKNECPQFFSLAFKENLTPEQNEKKNELSKKIDSSYRMHIQKLKDVQKDFADKHQHTVKPG